MTIKKLVVLSALLQCMSWSVVGAQPAQTIRIGGLGGFSDVTVQSPT